MSVWEHLNEIDGGCWEKTLLNSWGTDFTLCVWESNVATEIDRAVHLTLQFDVCVCVVGVHAAEWGERDCCNSLLCHGSASIEPHSIRLIHVYEHGHCPHTELCPSGLVWGCVCVCVDVCNRSFFFRLMIFCCSSADMGWWAVRGTSPWMDESSHTHRSVCILGPNRARGSKRWSIFSRIILSLMSGLFLSGSSPQYRRSFHFHPCV